MIVLLDEHQYDLTERGPLTHSGRFIQCDFHEQNINRLGCLRVWFGFQQHFLQAFYFDAMDRVPTLLEFCSGNRIAPCTPQGPKRIVFSFRALSECGAHKLIDGVVGHPSCVRKQQFRTGLVRNGFRFRFG